MRLEEMILVMENRNGVETNYLSSFEDYLKILEKIYPDRSESADAIAGLYETRQKKDYWVEKYHTSNETYSARFCGNINEVKKFLQGKFNEGALGNQLNEKQCSDECMEVLQAYGIDKNGNQISDAFLYEKIKNTSVNKGEIIKNFEGVEFRVMYVFNRKDFLLMSEKSGELMVVCGMEYLRRAPKAEYKSMDSVLYGMKWRQSIYLGSQITSIDFEQIKKEYAEQKNPSQKAPVATGPKL